LNLSGSHITYQAYIPTPAKTGLKGDPPGLEWAFMHKGASSILSPNWKLPARSAALFMNTFYKNWLELGYSRAKAWRATVLALKNGDPGAHPSIWAGFSLSGDWR
jgi:CHAT domain-containing protein